MKKNKSDSAASRLRIVVIAAIAIVLGGGLLLAATGPGSAVGDGSHTIVYEVPAGSGAIRVAHDLFEEGVLADPAYFRWYLTLTGNAGAIKTGVYELNDGMSAAEIATILVEGRVRMQSLTIPEGWNNRQIGDYLAEQGLIENREEFLRLARDPDVLRRFGILDETTEGYLFPETYLVPDGYSAAQLQVRMLERFQAVIAELAPEGMSAREIRDRVVLASIVEREAVRPEERPMMARVFLNRLDQRMRLESCATIQYLLDRPRARLYERDLRIPSPYNTYQHAGLPPGPISNPGRAALEAAFQPIENDYLFFVLKPDGSHRFSRTYQEHLDAKRRFLGT